MNQNMFASLKISSHFPEIKKKANEFEQEIKDVFINMESLIQNTLPDSEEKNAVIETYKAERKKKFTVRSNKYRRITTTFIPLVNNELRNQNSKRRPTQLKVKHLVSQIGTMKNGVGSILKDKSMELTRFMSEKSRNILKSPHRKVSSFNVTYTEYKDEGVNFKLIDKLNSKYKNSSNRDDYEHILFAKTISDFKSDKTKIPQIDPRVSIYSKFSEMGTPIAETKADTSYKSTLYFRNSNDKRKLIRYQKFIHGNAWKSIDGMETNMKKMEEKLEAQRNFTAKLLKRNKNNLKILTPPEVDIMREDLINTNDKFGYLYWNGKGEFSKSNSKKVPDFKLDLDRFELVKGSTNLDMLAKYRRLNQDRDNNVFVYYQGKPLTREEEIFKERIENFTRNKGLNAVRIKSEKLKCLMSEFNFRNVKR